MIETLTIPLLLVIAGVICVVLAIIGRISGKIEIIVPPERQRILGGVGAVFLVIGLVLGVVIQSITIYESVTSTPTPPITPTQPLSPTPQITVEITNPKNGTEISSPLTVDGTFKGELPEDWYLWMFVDNYEEWYPINRIEPFGGKWHSKIWFGSVTVGTRDIVVVLGDKDADSEFQRYSSEDGYLRILPQGAQVCDRITVEVRESHE